MMLDARILFPCVWTIVAVSAELPDIHMTLSPQSDRIFINDKTYVNTTIRFTKNVTSDVMITLLTSVDLPDFAFTKLTVTKVGKNLCYSGSMEPILDYANPELQTPGQAFVVQFNLGQVRNFGVHSEPEASEILVQYEAEVLKPLGNDVGHRHTLSTTFTAEGDSHSVYMEAVFSQTSLPLLFKSMLKPKMGSSLVRNMYIDTQDA